MRQTVTVTVDVELFAEKDDDGLTITDWTIGSYNQKNIIAQIVQEAIDNAHPGEWE